MRDAAGFSRTALTRFLRPTRSAAIALLAVVTLAPGGAPARTTQAADELRQIADEVWARQLETDIYARMNEGLPVDTLPAITYAAAREDADFSAGIVERLEAIDPTALSHDDWLTREILLDRERTTVEGIQYWGFTNLLTPYSSPIGSLRQLFGALPLRDETDAQRYVALMAQVPDMIRQMEALAREQLAAGFVISRENIPAITGIVRAVTLLPETGPFAVSDARVQELDKETVMAMRQEIARLVQRAINPALEKLSEFLEGEYAAAAPAAVGLAQYEGGRQYYDFRVRQMTTMDVTPEQVHEIGVNLVASMQESMHALQQEMGFDGTVQEFREKMRSDPANFPESVDRVAEEIIGPTRRFFEERAGDLFVVMPKAPFDVERLDPALEGSQTFGYYSPPSPADPRGLYHYNGSGLDERSWVPLAGIGFHELFPGHHFHIARQRENENLHPVRRNTMHGAYTEGWGSYSSLLGLEQGAVTDPMRRYGVWMLEVFLANRLVVDTGMNAFGMSLEDARQFMRENTFEADSQIASESLRYSTDMPAQALCYQMGKQGIVRLREKARAALGDRFDLRAFHEAVLGPGSMPMTVLEKHIDWFIAETLAGR